MHWLDIAALLILAFCATAGFIRGSVSEILDVLALGIAVALALVAVDAMFPPEAAKNLPSSSGSEFENISKLVVYLLGLGFAYYVPRRLWGTFLHSVSIMRVGARSRLIGATVGFLKGVSALVAVYLLVELVIPPSNWPRQWGEQAVSPWAIYHFVSGICGGLPPSMCPNIMTPPTGEPTALYSRQGIH
jgi:uncharacterized membrane protein required for colicin V production